ncbi:MAG: cytochrome c oxidase assembly protein [Rhodospirillales bacterium]|nr:cytochrome c oxidase assembly protein [Rhodospirillales bacterium]
MAPRQQRSRGRVGLTVLSLVAVVAGMGGLAFASQSLYQAFCAVTGFGGTTRVAQNMDKVAPVDQFVTVRFDANTNRGLPWKFRPVQREIKVRYGEQALAFFEATNFSDKAIVGTASFNVTPFKTATYFNKIQCFCFTEQVLRAGETQQMPVTFFVDPEILKDAYASKEKTITLSYTFFADENQSAAREVHKVQTNPDHIPGKNG